MGTRGASPPAVPGSIRPLKTKGYEVTAQSPPRFQAPFATGREVYTNFWQTLPPPAEPDERRTGSLGHILGEWLHRDESQSDQKRDHYQRTCE
jgi:hypothetical protein